jgi:hypothetical protein
MASHPDQTQPCGSNWKLPTRVETKFTTEGLIRTMFGTRSVTSRSIRAHKGEAEGPGRHPSRPSGTSTSATGSQRGEVPAARHLRPAAQIEAVLHPGPRAAEAKVRKVHEMVGDMGHELLLVAQ